MIFNRIEFPINGPLKLITLVMEWLIVFLFLEIALIFFIRIKIGKKNIKNLQDRAYFWLFLGYSIMWIFIIIGDYYIYNSYIRALTENIGFFILTICSLLFIFNIEKYKNFLRKYIFTIIFTIFIMIYSISFLFALEFAARVASLFWIVFLLFILFYIKNLYSDFYSKKELRPLKYDILKLCLGILLISIGYQLTTRVVVIAFGLGYRILGDILQLLGVIFIFIFLQSVATLSEHNWQDRIDSLFVVHKSGLFLYKKNFQGKSDIIDDNLISGGITTIEMLLEKTIKKRNFSIIEKAGKVIIIYPGEYIYGILIAREKLKSLQILLNNFIEKIEIIYLSFLKEWKGNKKIFESVENLVKEMFY